MNSFIQAMLDAGLSTPPEVIADGQIHRFDAEDEKHRSLNGWYVCFDDPPAGAFGDWKRDIKQTWSAKGYDALSDEEKARHRANMEAAKLAREQEQRRIRAECRKQCASIWGAAQPAPADHPYLVKKGVKPHGLKAYKGALLIRVGEGDNLHGLQFINADGEKLFKSGTDKRGHYHSIGGTPTSVLYLAEGYATAASIHEATGEPVAVCFDAGNIQPVLSALRQKLPDIQMTVCADNDRNGGENIGVIKATEAAQAEGALLAVPQFPEGVTGTDFNDLAQACGLEEVKRQVEAADRPPEKSKSQPVATANPANSAKNGSWDELLPLQGGGGKPESYPLDALPGIIGDAVKTYAEYGQQPIPMIASSALANVSLACQCHCDVARDRVLRSPISLFFLSVAESGERKSAADKAFSTVPREWIIEEQYRAKKRLKELGPEVEAWEQVKAGILADLKKNVAKPEKLPELKNRLAGHEREKPELPLIPELYFGDSNQASLIGAIANNALYGCSLWDDEGGNIIGGNGTSPENVTAYFSVINKLWDGNAVKQTRVAEDRIVDGRRLTANIMVQESILNLLIHGHKGLSRGCGLLARFLITYPQSTIGFRPYQEPPPLTELHTMGNRLVELLDYASPVDEKNRLDLPVLQLAPEAKRIWEDFYNETESSLRPHGEFAGVKDITSKIADNAARIAANLHVFQHGATGQISSETMERAAMIALFHLTEARRVYGMVETSQGWKGAEALLSWLESERGLQPTPRKEIMQRGPNQIRKKEHLDAALLVLQEHGITREATIDGKRVVEVNPEYKAGGAHE
jgi:putative DNA primase/helicase